METDYINKRREGWYKEEPRLTRNSQGRSQATKTKIVVSYKYRVSIGIRIELNVGGLNLRGGYSQGYQLTSIRDQQTDS